MPFFVESSQQYDDLYHHELHICHQIHVLPGHYEDLPHHLRKSHPAYCLGFHPAFVARSVHLLP